MSFLPPSRRLGSPKSTPTRHRKCSESSTSRWKRRRRRRRSKVSVAAAEVAARCRWRRQLAGGRSHLSRPRKGDRWRPKGCCSGPTVGVVFFFFFCSPAHQAWQPLLHRHHQVNCLQSGGRPAHLQALCCPPVDACSNCNCKKKKLPTNKAAVRVAVANRFHPVTGVKGELMSGEQGEGTPAPDKQPTTGSDRVA